MLRGFKTYLVQKRKNEITSEKRVLIKQMKDNLKYFISLLLIVSMFSQSLIFSYLIVAYATDNKAFTEKYCQNIAKPELECNGKCHLKSELAKTLDDGESKSTEQRQKITFQSETLFFEAVSTFQFQQNFRLLDKNINASYINLHFNLYTNTSFHPPQNQLLKA